MHTELAVFQDRAEAGRVLADRLTKYAGSPEVVVLALPRVGVPVGFQVARSLGALLDVLSVRKLGVPGREELAMGAIASDGTRVVNRRVVGELGIAEDTLQAVAAAEQQELERRERTYRGQRLRPELTGKVVIVVDDGHRGDHVGGGGRDPPPTAGPGRGRGAGRGGLDLPGAGAGCRRGHLRHSPALFVA